MRTLASILAAGAVALALTGCGGDSGVGQLGNGSGTGTKTTTTTTYEMGNGTGGAFQAGMIGLSSGNLSAGGSTSLAISIVDKTGTLYTSTSPVEVVLNSPCLAAKQATISEAGATVANDTIGTTSGLIDAVYTAAGCSGSDVITATATVGSQTLSATATITVAAAATGSLQFVSATPSSIGLKGTGLQETSTVVFKVVDATGGPKSGVTVSFALNSTVGGMTLSPASAVSATDGTVQTVVSSGTVHTSVRVTATIASPALSTQSSLLAVTTGLPASAGFSIAVGPPSYKTSLAGCPNVESYNTDGVTVPITARLADRYNNPAPDGTAVAFYTTGGHIVGTCTTPSAPGAADGTCTATWTSADPRPQLADDSPPLKAPGRATILATVIGEESFTDTNGNGYWDSGEPFQNLGEPYADANENGQYDLGEHFLDFNQNGKWDAGDGTFKGITCTGSTPGSTCTTTTLAISAHNMIIMTTGQSVVTITSTTGFGTSGTTLTIPHGTSGFINYNVADQNGNVMANGTAVTVAADAAIGTVPASTASWSFGCDTTVGGKAFGTAFNAAATPASGALSITTASPGGVNTTWVFPISVQ